MIEALIVAVLGAIALSYVVRPVVTGTPGGPTPANEAQDDALERKRAALVAILDIETERDAGKLSEEDFAELRAEYEAEAITALRELDATGATEDDLEAEIARVRARLECPICGAPRAPGETCPRCGG